MVINVFLKDDLLFKSSNALLNHMEERKQLFFSVSILAFCSITAFRVTKFSALKTFFFSSKNDSVP